MENGTNHDFGKIGEIQEIKGKVFLPFHYAYYRTAGEDQAVLNDFFKEAVAKNDEAFKGTAAEIGFRRMRDGISQCANNLSDAEYNSEKYDKIVGLPQTDILKRSGLVTTIYSDPILRSAGLFPITPEESEKWLLHLRENYTSKVHGGYAEDGYDEQTEAFMPYYMIQNHNGDHLAFILFDASPGAANQREAVALKASLLERRKEPGQKDVSFERPVIVVHAGLVKDAGSAYGVAPKVLPGITQAYNHDALDNALTIYKQKGGSYDNWHMFSGFGINGGLPDRFDESRHSRTRFLYMPEGADNLGLREFRLGADKHLYANETKLDEAGQTSGIFFALKQMA